MAKIELRAKLEKAYRIAMRNKDYALAAYICELILKVYNA